MNMNRETKRRLQRQGQLGPDGSPSTAPREKAVPRTTPKPAAQRTSPAQFVREVRGELRKVAWPTRDEVTNYSVIVLITLAILIALIFGLDYMFAKSSLFLFK
jgi:preprotein translocase subunit SecE